MKTVVLPRWSKAMTCQVRDKTDECGDPSSKVCWWQCFTALHGVFGSDLDWIPMGIPNFGLRTQCPHRCPAIKGLSQLICKLFQDFHLFSAEGHCPIGSFSEAFSKQVWNSVGSLKTEDPQEIGWINDGTVTLHGCPTGWWIFIWRCHRRSPDSTITKNAEKSSENHIKGVSSSSWGSPNCIKFHGWLILENPTIPQLDDDWGPLLTKRTPPVLPSDGPIGWPRYIQDLSSQDPHVRQALKSHAAAGAHTVCCICCWQCNTLLLFCICSFWFLSSMKILSRLHAFYGHFHRLGGFLASLAASWIFEEPLECVWPKKNGPDRGWDPNRECLPNCPPWVGRGQAACQGLGREGQRPRAVPPLLDGLQDSDFVVGRGDVDMVVSWNRGTSKSSILVGFSLINQPFWGTPISGNTHMWIPPKNHPSSQPLGAINHPK